jgi:hypothetical protein
LDVGCVEIDKETVLVQSSSGVQKEKQQNDRQGTARHQIKRKQMLATIKSSLLKTKETTLMNQSLWPCLCCDCCSFQ